MHWYQALLHLGNFLLLPIFLGTAIGMLARMLWYKNLSYTLSIFAGISGSLCGLIAGWVLTGRDGHTIGYILCITCCSLFVLITGGKISSATSRNKTRKASKS